MECETRVVLLEDWRGRSAGEIIEVSRWEALAELIPQGRARRVRFEDLKRRKDGNRT